MRNFMFALCCVVAGSVASTGAFAKIDTLTGLTPGDKIGCDYTFKNGNPSIPCAQDVVGDDGKVSFQKPNAPYDNIEYFKIVGGNHIPIVAILDPINDPILPKLHDGMYFPLIRQGDSFFDVFFEIDLSGFLNDNLWVPGTFTTGQILNFADGENTDGYGSLSVPNYTGQATVFGFDIVTPEPLTLTIFGAGLFGVYGMTKRRKR
jgi:hypothetical protein